MEENKGVSLMVECEDCKQKFEISSIEANGKVTHKREFKIEGKSIFLTYYDCPSCGRRHYVQIDDSFSLNKLNEVNRMFIKMSVAKRKGKAIPEKQQDKFKKARQNLSNYRIFLMKEYTDKLLYDSETDSKFVLRFSI